MKVDINVEYLKRALKCFEGDTWELIENVVDDLEDNPPHSAVVAKNHIVWIIDLYQSLGIEKRYSDVRSFILDDYHDESFYEAFEQWLQIGIKQHENKHH
jgi:hypothetical protein